MCFGLVSIIQATVNDCRFIDCLLTCFCDCQKTYNSRGPTCGGLEGEGAGVQAGKRASIKRLELIGAIEQAVPVTEQVTRRCHHGVCSFQTHSFDSGTRSGSRLYRGGDNEGEEEEEEEEEEEGEEEEDDNDVADGGDRLT